MKYVKSFELGVNENKAQGEVCVTKAAHNFGEGWLMNS